jgi:hypothetical protein
MIININKKYKKKARELSGEFYREELRGDG